MQARFEIFCIYHNLTGQYLQQIFIPCSHTFSQHVYHQQEEEDDSPVAVRG